MRQAYLCITSVMLIRAASVDPRSRSMAVMIGKQAPVRLVLHTVFIVDGTGSSNMDASHRAGIGAVGGIPGYTLGHQILLNIQILQ